MTNEELIAQLYSRPEDMAEELIKQAAEAVVSNSCDSLSVRDTLACLAEALKSGKGLASAEIELCVAFRIWRKQHQADMRKMLEGKPER